MRADAASLPVNQALVLQTARDSLRVLVVWGILFPILLGSATAQPVRNEELQDVYKKWVEQHVVYIITPEEKSVFEGLTTGSSSSSGRDVIPRRVTASMNSRPSTTGESPIPTRTFGQDFPVGPPIGAASTSPSDLPTV